MSSSLPERPDLDQLKRRARELLRDAKGGDPDAISRIRVVSERATLAAAQLAIAREHGFASWARLKSDVERRMLVGSVGSAASVPWPDVVMETGRWPQPMSRGFMSWGIKLAGPPEVIARGAVDGIPFSLRVMVTEPAPGAEWWEVNQSVGPEAEFSFGEGGSYGGGSVPADIPDGYHLVLVGHSYSEAPQFVLWAGCVSEDVARVEVHADGDAVRSYEPIAAPEGHPGFVLLFLHRSLSASVVAVDALGDTLQRWDLPELPHSDTGNSVAMFGGQRRLKDEGGQRRLKDVGGPPQGWPKETRTFERGEGPRREEDFLLHIASFPLYVIPPERWQGLIGLGGSGGSGEGRAYRVEHVQFSYIDVVGSPTRGIEVVSARPGYGLPFEDWSPRDDDGWTFDTHSASMPDILGRFGDHQLFLREPRHALGRRYLGHAEIPVEGRVVRFDRWAFFDYPALLQLRAELPDGAVRLEGWAIQWNELEAFAARLERLTLDSALFKRMEAAQAALDAAWKAWFEAREGPFNA